MPESATLFCPLDRTGFIEVRGADARAFLHAQLGIDMLSLPTDSAPLAAWHDARGRVRALFRVFSLDAGFLLMLPAAQMQDVTARLGMFILRSKVEIGTADHWRGAAVIGAVPDEWPDAEAAPGALVRDGETRFVRAAPGLTYVVSAEPARLDDLADALTTGTIAHAELAEIENGLPCISHETSERYLPQMLNLDRLGAMSFSKGCYPGQEVIARTHHLGSVKRRLARFAIPGDTAAEVGATVETEDGTSVGEVLRAAAAAGRSELLAVVRTEARDAPLYVSGRRLEPLPLPY